jgi:glycosyltransferase involved in cell wall biosynthesis
MDMQQNRIKLLKFVATLGVGGTESQVLSLGWGLDPSTFELHVAYFRRWGNRLKEIEARQIPSVEYHINCLYNLQALKEQLRFARDIKRNRIQIVHTYGFYPNVFAVSAARLAGIPVIVASIRDSGDVWTPMQRRVQKFMCRLADCIVVNAEAVRQRLIEDGYPQEKVTVIPNGVHLSRFARNGNSSRLRNDLRLPPHAPLVAVLSRLDRVKGLEYFLEATTIVCRRFPEARFLIVGDDQAVDRPYKRELEGYAVRLGLGERVVFTGFRLDVPEVLSEITVSVLPSLSEGLSNVLLESMAAGVPVVATRVGGNPEVVEEGVTGLLVPPRDPQALASAMCRLLENPELASRFGRAGRQRVTEHFSIERMVQETERLYLRLLRRASDEKRKDFPFRTTGSDVIQ